MSINRGFRRLTTPTHTYLWQVTHRHDEGCAEVLTIRRVGSSSGRALHFRPDPPGRLVSDGGTWPTGVVSDDVHGLWNLNEPGTVRALVDALTVADWPGGDRGYRHVDGWEWLAGLGQ